MKSEVKCAGLDHENLSVAYKTSMNLGGAAAKSRKDIWDAGQGVGRMEDAPSDAEVVARLLRESRDLGVAPLEDSAAHG